MRDQLESIRGGPVISTRKNLIQAFLHFYFYFMQNFHTKFIKLFSYPLTHAGRRRHLAGIKAERVIFQLVHLFSLQLTLSLPRIKARVPLLC